MTRFMANFPYRQVSQAQGSNPTTHGAIEFLRTHEKMAGLLPSLARIAELQKECADLLPAAFKTCAVMQFESGCLVLSVPNAALAAKLKQTLPKLQETLQKRGWQVSSIKLKVQVGQGYTKASPVPPEKKLLPRQAVSALSDLEEKLDSSSRNAALKAAIQSMIERHRRSAG